MQCVWKSGASLRSALTVNKQFTVVRVVVNFSSRFLLFVTVKCTTTSAGLRSHQVVVYIGEILV